MFDLERFLLLILLFYSTQLLLYHLIHLTIIAGDLLLTDNKSPPVHTRT